MFCLKIAMSKATVWLLRRWWGAKHSLNILLKDLFQRNRKRQAKETEDGISTTESSEKPTRNEIGQRNVKKITRKVAEIWEGKTWNTRVLQRWATTSLLRNATRTRQRFKNIASQSKPPYWKQARGNCREEPENQRNVRSAAQERTRKPKKNKGCDWKVSKQKWRREPIAITNRVTVRAGLLFQLHA